MKQKDRIDELERRVRELEARPPMVVYPPYYVPHIPPSNPWDDRWKITYGDRSTTGDSTCGNDGQYRGWSSWMSGRPMS